MTQRRAFIKAIMLCAVASATASANTQSRLSNGVPTLSGSGLKPKRLSSGDTIGLIAPSSNTWENQEIYFAMDILRSFGFKVKPGKFLFQRHGYLAGFDKQRASDLNAMFADNSVDGIICLRGGYGSPRILPEIDYALITNHPKVFLGYSDVTALLNAIYARSGLMTFHGPIAKQNFSDYTLNNFKKILFEPQTNIELATPPFFEPMEGRAEKDNRLTVVSPGKASGRLIGGNLSLMVKLIGSPFEPDYKGKILFLEDVEEAPYRIDGMLTHLRLAQRLDQLAGIVFGKCTQCEVTDGNSLSVEQVLQDRLGDLGIPVLSGVMIGHIDDMATIPVGASATLDATNKRLVLNETAVS